VCVSVSVCVCVGECDQMQQSPSTPTMSRKTRQEYIIVYIHIYIYKTIIKLCNDYFEAKVSRYSEYATGLSVGGSIHDEGKGFPLGQNPSRLALGPIHPPQMCSGVLSVSKAVSA